MKRVLLLGAGYANLSLLKSLPFLQDVKITLISNNAYHYASVLLHEVAAGSRNRSVLFNLKDILDSSVEFIEDEVKEIKEKSVVCKNGEYEYDFLSIGLGFHGDDFGIKGVKEFTLPLNSYKDAIFIREKIYSALETYKETKDSTYLNFVVCGGGFSGSELVASLSREIPKACNKLKIDSSKLNIYCIEAMNNILPMFPDNLIDSGSRYLKKHKVKILVNHKIVEIKDSEVLVQENENIKTLYARTIIWTAGVKGNSVIENSPFLTNNMKISRSKIEVDSCLHPKSLESNTDSSEDIESKFENIFVLGDCAALIDENTNKFYAPTAQLAESQGEYATKALCALLDNDEYNSGFVYHSAGIFCSLGKSYGLGISSKKGAVGRTFEGFLALSIKRFIEFKWKFKLIGISAFFK